MKRVLITLLLAGCVTTTSTLTLRERALLALQRGRPAEAVKVLDELVAERPDDLELTRAWAEAHVKNGTSAVLLAAIEGKDTAAAHYARGLVRFSSAKDAHGPAVREFELAIERAPKEAELHHRLGIALLEAEDFEGARSRLAEALSLDSSRRAWHLPLAKALARVGQTKPAIESLRTVLTGDCTPAEAATAKALMDELSDPFAGFPKAARGKLDAALQWLESADVPQQAMSELEDIARDFPDLGVVHALLGLAAARVDDAGRAVEELKRAIELSPEDGKAYLYLADLYTARQRGAQAKELYERALEKNPSLDDAWFRLGDLALDRQDLEKARMAFRTAARLKPESWSARGKLALVLQLESNWVGADRELRAEIDTHPDNLEAVLRLGLLHTEKYLKVTAASDKKAAAKEATVWLEKLLDQQPENALASRALERVKQP